MYLPKIKEKEDNKMTEENSIQKFLEIDDMLGLIAEIDENIEKYKALKQYRTKTIDEEVNRLKDKRDNLRNSIAEYMLENEETKLVYPGMAEVVNKKAKGKWVIKDEDKLIEFLHSIKTIDELRDIGVILEKPQIVKKNLDKLLEDLNTKEELDTDSVVYDQPANAISIKFENKPALINRAKKMAALDQDNASVEEVSDIAIDDFDGLSY